MLGTPTLSVPPPRIRLVKPYKSHQMPKTRHPSRARTLADYLTISEAARLLGVCASTLRNWDRAGKLHALRHPVNSYRLYRIDKLELLIRNVEVPRRRRRD